MNTSPTNLREYGRELWKYRDLLRLLVMKNVKLKYRRSFLGYVWSVLNPLLIMIVMTVVFSSMFHRKIENFPVYLFCGQLLFNFMRSSTQDAANSIKFNAPLLKKTYVPKYIFTLARITSGLVELCFSLGALVIVMVFTRSPFRWTVLLFPLVLVQVYVFCVGLGLFLAQANVFFKDTQFIYNAVTTAWLYLTPIFYPIDSLSPWLQKAITHCNPMYFYIRQFRDLIWTGVLPQGQLVLAGVLAAAGMLVIGVWSFLRSEDRFILYI